MSSISSSNDNTNYYRDVISDLGKQHELELKKNRLAREEELERIQQVNERVLRRRDDETAESIQRMRDATESSLENQRQKYEEAIKELNSDKYSRYGLKERDELKKYYTGVVQNLNDQIRAEEKRHTQIEDAQAERSRTNLREEIDQQRYEANETIKSIQDTAREALSKQKEEYESELEDQKRSLYNNRGQSFEVNSEADRLKGELERVEESKKRQKESFEASIERMQDNQSDVVKDLNRQTEKTLAEVKNQNDAQIRDYADQLKYTELSTKDKLDKKNEEVAERDNFNRRAQARELKHVGEDYERSFDHIKDNNDKNEHTVHRKNNALLTAQNDHFSNVVRDLNTRHGQELDKVQKDLQDQVDKLRSQELKESDDFTEKLGETIRTSNTDKETALTNQSKIFKDALIRQKQSDDLDIALLQKALAEKPDSSNSTLVPPAIEDSIRKSVIQEYEKTLKTERENRSTQADGIQYKYAEMHRQALEQAQDKIAGIERKNSLIQANDRSEYMNSMNDMRYTNDAEARSQTTGFERERESMLRDYALALQRQKREYDFIAENSHADASARLAQVREDAMISIRNLHRELQTRQNELITQYDTKLANQQEEYEAKLDEVKENNSMELRTLERKNKQELETQTRAAEKRIEEMDLKNKERERSITQNYQALLDRTRRNYELTSKKKS